MNGELVNDPPRLLTRRDAITVLGLAGAGLIATACGTCAPIKDAAVDVWHCDAGGEYSGFGSGDGYAAAITLGVKH